MPNGSLASAAGFCGADGCPQFIGVSGSVLRREKHCAVVKLRSTLQRQRVLPLNLMAVTLQRGNSYRDAKTPYYTPTLERGSERS
ncbi:MAG: hypothetical protein GY862_14890 [Gammaproteobacteria bacterium]|nr:hypothetical protein [Gammaproteobacteria bacterium]